MACHRESSSTEIPQTRPTMISLQSRCRTIAREPTALPADVDARSPHQVSVQERWASVRVLGTSESALASDLIRTQSLPNAEWLSSLCESGNDKPSPRKRS
ncbi:hypothetical protein CORC01_01149 [Colletotrichum orchidophilum]|uniref:Uncharacterized protein n=1 Tax=Colletotrichum orchidophilum TaxID=1209926 RepID=A0A1G4BPN7_9PEZI|nr:uncharacterized protein CORC01_01149 [Colletotrichum orchidophilum]OHF03430.1 hypothetical protein CORC01_01149 [Colletotrichum orchidophilum]